MSQASHRLVGMVCLSPPREEFAWVETRPFMDVNTFYRTVENLKRDYVGQTAHLTYGDRDPPVHFVYEHAGIRYIVPNFSSPPRLGLENASALFTERCQDIRNIASNTGMIVAAMAADGDYFTAFFDRKRGQYREVMPQGFNEPFEKALARASVDCSPRRHLPERLYTPSSIRFRSHL